MYVIFNILYVKSYVVIEMTHKIHKPKPTRGNKFTCSQFPLICDNTTTKQQPSPASHHYNNYSNQIYMTMRANETIDKITRLFASLHIRHRSRHRVEYNLTFTSDSRQECVNKNSRYFYYSRNWTGIMESRGTQHVPNSPFSRTFQRT